MGSAIDRFRSKYKLEAVMQNDSAGYAVVKGQHGQRVVSVGDSLDGFEVISVDDRTARFSFNGIQIELELELDPEA